MLIVQLFPRASFLPVPTFTSVLSSPRIPGLVPGCPNQDFSSPWQLEESTPLAHQGQTSFVEIPFTDSLRVILILYQRLANREYVLVVPVSDN